MACPILIIDDNVQLCKSLAQNFNQLGYKSYLATNSKEAIHTFSNNSIEAVLLDIKLGEDDGINTLMRLLEIKNRVPVIMITGYGSIESAVQSLKIGAYDYVQKPLDFDKLLNIVEKAVESSNLEIENRHVRERLVEYSPRLISQDEHMKEMLNKAKRLACTDLPVLIIGENGTGKEIMADYIHTLSQRSCRKMVKINCAAFPENLLDNELFGHEKGAYTGADSAFKGVFERADGSSLFLDEISDMSSAIQAKILRVLQNCEIRRIGGDKTIKINVRFVAASNKDLENYIELKRFREDLYYRLNAASISIPPLRARKADIPLLIDYFLQEFATYNSKDIGGVSEKALHILCAYSWPGNVRELKNAVNYAAAISVKDVIGVEDLPTYLSQGTEEQYSYNIREETERNLIIKMLKKMDNNKKKTAEILNMSRKTLYNKLEKYGLSAQ
jgi:DNA-binding NtrC family response regulator